MELLSLIPSVYAKFSSFILIFTRISALFSTFILFRRDIVSTRIMLALTLVLSFYMNMLLADDGNHYDVFSFQAVPGLFFQFLIGFIAGLVLNLVFEMFSAFGQIVSSQIGLGMASIMDPRMGHITSLTNFYIFTIMLLFLMLNGHLFIIKLILDSFSTIPLDKVFIPQHIISDVLRYSSVMFSGSALLSITIVIVILLSNFALALMSKFAPQFNLFSIGINISLIIGLIYVYLTFDLFAEKSSYFIQDCLMFLHRLIMGAA